MHIMHWILTILIVLCSASGLIWNLTPLLPGFLGSDPVAKRIIRRMRIYALGLGIMGMVISAIAPDYPNHPVTILILSFLLLPLLPGLPKPSKATEENAQSSPAEH